MALSKDKKSEVVAEVAQLLTSSKLTVLAKYPGTSVKAMQQLRADAKASGTQVLVIKNRLFKKALESDERFKGTDTGFLTGQLLYAFNDSDEVAPAQSLAQFAKTETQLEFVGGYDATGQMLSADDIKALANLPSKQQLRGQLVGIIASPLSGLVGTMSANLRGVLNVLEARSESIN